MGEVPGNLDEFAAPRESAQPCCCVPIGGLDGDLSHAYRPNDPLYWSIAAFADLLWAEWQQRNPGLAHTYSGEPGALLEGFGVPVSATFDTTAPDFGYTYDRWSAPA